MILTTASYFISTLILLIIQVNGQKNLENEAKNYLKELNERLTSIYKQNSRANWAYEVFYSEKYLEQIEEVSSKSDAFFKGISGELYELQQNAKNFKNPDIKRKIYRLRKPNYNSLSNVENEEINVALSDMREFFQNVKICSYFDKKICNLTLIPEVQDILHKSNDLDEIEYYWVEWRNETGLRVQKSFEKFIELYKKASIGNNLTTPSQMWYYDFESENKAQKQVEDIINQLRPLFEQYHAYVRYLLQQKYGEKIVPSNEAYPQHIAEILLGESFRYESGGSDFKFPYPNKIIPNVTEFLIDRSFTPEKMFDLTREFFVSIGMTELPETFWTNRAFPVAKPNDRVLSCWNKAWNFYSHNEIEFTYCPKVVDFTHFLNMYEAVTDAYTFHYYQDLPAVYQSEPLPTFSEAIGNIISLSASSPRYLKKIGAIPEDSFDNETMLNRLYLRGMQNIFLLPVLHVLDKYRVEILDNKIKSWDNCEYWNLNVKYTGSKPPIMRNNNQFDAPAKLLIGADEEYSSLIMTSVMQFQIYKHFCKKIGQYKPNDPEYALDNCDLSGHKEVGNLLKKALALGSSKPWRSVLQTLTGTAKLDTSGFLEYFKPLQNWLIETNKKNNVKVGWDDISYCS